MPERPALDPEHTALLVMDYQVGIVAQLPETRSLLDRVVTAVENVRARGGHLEPMGVTIPAPDRRTCVSA